MKSSIRFLMASTLTAAAFAPSVLRAQQEDVGPPPILTIQREYLKPGHAGAAHEKTEAAYLAAAKAMKAPYRYIALTSMSGLDRALFVSSYPSLAAWEEETKAAGKIAGLNGALDHAMLSDGDNLTSSEESVWMHRPDLSYAEMKLHGVRYFELQQITVKPGKVHEFEEMAHLFAEGYKSIEGANWATYQQIYGPDNNRFLIMTLLKSLKEADAEYGPSGEAFAKALGPEKMKRLRALESDAIEAEQTNLFRIDPKMSLPFEGLVTGEPDFWKPKAAAMPAKKTEEKPKQ